MSDSGFSDKWQTNSNKENVLTKVKNKARPQSDLKKKLGDTERALASQISKLDRSITRMNEKEKSLFAKTSEAFQKHDTAQANAYANELAELRKALKLVNSAKLSLESVQARLTTITDIGDLAVTLVPVGQVVKTVRKTLMKVMPAANESIGDINSGLEGLMQEIGNISGLSFNLDNSLSEEAEKILAEASVIAEQKMENTLPGLPGTTADPSSTDSSF